MKNIKIKLLAVFFSAIVLFGISTTAHASLSLTADVDVPASCSATDTDGVVHDYPQGSSYLGICALEAAIQTGSLTGAELSNQFPSLGLFVAGINGVAADPSSQYWALYQNGNFASSGITTLPVVAGDAIMFQLHDFSDTDLGDRVTINVRSVVAPAAPATLSSIAITTPATKLNYTVGDILDISGLVVTGTYSDSTIKTEIITAANISGFDSGTPAADQILTITDGTQTTTYTVNITAGSSGGHPTHLSLTADVDVPASCSATDTDGVVHDYPQGSSYLGICALEAAIQTGSLTGAELSNQFPSLGLFVAGINGVAADPSSQYWALYQNGNFASSGITTLPVVAGDAIMFQLHDFSDTDLGDRVTINVRSFITNTPNNNGGGNGSGGGIVTTVFSVPSAISYLQSVQSSDGSFGGSDLYSDWAGVAIGASGATGIMRTNLLAYMASHNSLSSLLTDNERRAIALLSLGQNPYAFSGTNYIASIVNKFDGKQFGDASLVNDDIFALIPLSRAGYTESDDIISKDIAFVLSKQQSEGSWNSDVDFTAAAIQALSPFRGATGVSDALVKASSFLQNSEQSDGGFGNISSSSWAIQAMSALSASWAKSGKTPANYLGTQQATDGAALPPSEALSNRIWTTSYAIPAAVGKPWGNIMQSVSKQIDQKNSNNPGADSPKTPDAKVPASKDPVTCAPGDLFSITTGQLCAAVTLINPNNPPLVNPETPKKQKKIFSLPKNKVAIKNITKPNLKNDVNQNTASVINAIPSDSTETQEPAPKSWFARLLEFFGL